MTTTSRGTQDLAPESSALFIAETGLDPVLCEPYVDADRPGTTTDPATGVSVSYRYVHGGFTGTDARFSLYFPAPEEYQGRFFQFTYPVIAEEDAAPEVITFAISHGAYVVSTNNGGGVTAAPELGGYRVNAAAAKHSRVVAAQVYGIKDRPRGYLYGGSGGAYQTMGAMENTQGVWDGGVPFVPGVPDAIPNFGAAAALARRVLGDKLAGVADAMEPGGSGDPFAALSAEQQAVLEEVTRLGFPLRGWWIPPMFLGWAFHATQSGVRLKDPSYVEDFWNDPAYEGADPAVRKLRAQVDTVVEARAADGTEAAKADPSGDLVGEATFSAPHGGAGVTLATVPDGYLVGADLVVTSGPAAGKAVAIGAVGGNRVVLGPFADPEVVAQLVPGTSVRIDNSWLLALHYYHRHQVPPSDAYGWDQFRQDDGTARPPQRPRVGPSMAANAGGAAPTGRFHGKMIMVAAAQDTDAYPWSADWYRRRAEEALGDQAGEHFRLWYVDNACHGPNGAAHLGTPSAATHVVPYLGVLQQALLDLDAWVAQDTPPPASSEYLLAMDAQVELLPTAHERLGVQAVVSLTAHAGDGAEAGERVDVGAGTPVTLTVQVDMPPGAGTPVAVEWDLEGTGRYADPLTLTLTQEHTFTRPGTYFPTVRVTSHREADTATPFRLVQNLARVRVVVRS